ncbi:hypothetical protein BGZ82_001399 [Podila clonocystis]|nr:hypothetical protein BGZ82_001399 [Podila clonocystis]
MSPTSLFPTKSRSIHIYTDFDSTVTLHDTGDVILAHEMGQQELVRIDRLPETDPQNYSLRKAEDMKWDHVRLSVKEAVDILIGPGPYATQEQIAAYKQAEKRKPFDAVERPYRVEIDPGFEPLYRFCKEHGIPITVVSINIQPFVEEMLNRFLGVGHGIEVRANGLTFQEDGTWKVLWRDSSPFGIEKGRALREARATDLQDPTDCILWCGDGSSDFPAALESDIVLARQGTPLEKLCKANQIEHTVFTSFSTVQEKVEEWLATNSKEQ